MTDFNEFDCRISEVNLLRDRLSHPGTSWITHRYLLGAIREYLVGIFAAAAAADQTVAGKLRPGEIVAGGDFHLDDDDRLILQPASDAYGYTPIVEKVAKALATYMEEQNVTVRQIVISPPKNRILHPFWTHGKLGSTL